MGKIWDQAKKADPDLHAAKCSGGTICIPADIQYTPPIISQTELKYRTAIPILAELREHRKLGQFHVSILGTGANIKRQYGSLNASMLTDVNMIRRSLIICRI